MAARGRPPAPLEERGRRGRSPERDPGGRKLPEPASGAVDSLPSAPDGGPEPPDYLGHEGRDLWNRAWAAAITWLSPATDMTAVLEACQLLDDLAVARQVYRTTRAATDAKTVTALSKQMTEALGALGFNPTARGRLGVAEVKRQSQLESLLEKRRSRGA